MIANKPKSPSILLDSNVLTGSQSDSAGPHEFFKFGNSNLTSNIYTDLQNNSFVEVLKEFGVQGVINFVACTYDNDASGPVVEFGCRIQVDGNMIFSMSNVQCQTNGQAGIIPIGMLLWDYAREDMAAMCFTPIYFYRDFSIEVFATDYAQLPTIRQLGLFYDYLITGQARL